MKNDVSIFFNHDNLTSGIAQSEINQSTRVIYKQ